jgi:hypothetical protein
MAQIPRQLIVGLGLMALIASAQAGGFRLWAELSPLEQAALAPIASDWNHLPAQQQEKLIKVAKGFTKLTPKQRQVLHARLVNWTRMTPEQRKIARENYKKLLELPLQQQVQIKRRWMEARGVEQTGEAPAADIGQ